MPITVLLAAFAVASAVPLLWWSLAATRRPRAAAISRNLGAPLVDVRATILQRSASDRAVRPAMRWLADTGRRLTPARMVEQLERRLVAAGRPPSWPLERVLAGKVLLGVGAFLLTGFMVLERRSFGWVLVWLGVTALAYFTPDILLSSRGDDRQQALQKALPDTLDQMSIAVQAGLGFESAMARAARNGSGPLADELTRTLQELQLGVSRAQAFRNLAERTQVADIRQFVHAILQADSFGIPIAEVLHVQADEQRDKRRQRAEEKAMKIPVKVIFPLLICIFPALFIVILGPAVIRLANFF